jgi:hypothetical protein
VNDFIVRYLWKRKKKKTSVGFAKSLGLLLKQNHNHPTGKPGVFTKIATGSCRRFCMTNEDILKALADLTKPDYDVHVIDNAWYSVRAMTAALTNNKELIEAYPKVSAVRVRLPGGMLELHPTEDGKIHVKCYCCFGGSPDKGIVPLDKLKERVVSLKEHHCPPWPG